MNSKFVDNKRQIKRKTFYKIPDCSDNGKQLNENGISFYTKYKDLDKEDNITCYAAEQDISAYNAKINNIDNVIKYRNDFTATCINSQYRDQGHNDRIKVLNKERKNCEKKITQEGKRKIQMVHGEIIDSYIQTNQQGNIGIIVNVDNVDHDHITQLYKYLVRKMLVKDTGIRKLSKKIDMINQYFHNIKNSKSKENVMMIGDVPVKLNSKTKSTDSIIMIGDVPVVLKSNSPQTANTTKAKRPKRNTTKKNTNTNTNTRATK